MLPPVWAGGEWSHVLGTDNLGRDLLSRLIYGARASLGVGFSVVAIAGSVGVGIGMLAGYAGGIFDRVAMRVVDAQLAIPDVLLALIVLAVIGPSFWAIVVVLSIGGWMIYGRTVRNIVVSARKEAYVVAAEMVGARQSRILIRHILPNLVAPLLTLGTLEVASVILAEAALSFLGVGIQPPMTSWGLDISKGRDFLFTNPWLVMLPGIAITLTILSINLLATFLRRTTDPVEREKRFGLAYRRRNRSPAAKRGRPSRPVSAGEQTLLEIDDLTVAFETRLGRLHVVRGVSLSVKRGETLAVVGESGSGKSVTMQAVMGLIEEPGRIEGGEILWKSQSMLDPKGPGAKARGKAISIVFQDAMSSLNPLFTVGTQIIEVIERHTDMHGADARRRAVELLGLVGIARPEERLRQLPHQFSGGMQQRIMIAIALAAEPEMLIADEPTTALDVTIQAQIVDLLISLQQRLDLSVLLVTHDLGLVAELSDRVVVMYCGQVVETGAVSNIFRNPAHPYTRGLLNSTPSIERSVDKWTAIEGSPPDPRVVPRGCAFRSRCTRARAECESAPPLDAVGHAHEARCWFPLPAKPLDEDAAR